MTEELLQMMTLLGYTYQEDADAYCRPSPKDRGVYEAIQIVGLRFTVIPGEPPDAHLLLLVGNAFRNRTVPGDSIRPWLGPEGLDQEKIDFIQKMLGYGGTVVLEPRQGKVL